MIGGKGHIYKDVIFVMCLKNCRIKRNMMKNLWNEEKFKHNLFLLNLHTFYLQSQYDQVIQFR